MREVIAQSLEASRSHCDPAHGFSQAGEAISFLGLLRQPVSILRLPRNDEARFVVKLLLRGILLPALVSIFIFVQLSPVDASESGYSLAEKYFLEGNYNSAISKSGELIESGSGRKDELYYLKGLSELKVNKFSDARASFNYIISNYSWSKKVFDARLGLGDSYLLEGDTAKAASVYNGMIEKYPSDKNIAIVYSRLSSVYARTGARNKADSYHAMAKAKAPLSFEVKSAPAVSPQPQVPASHAAISSGIGIEKGEYSIQVGSFKNKRNADKLAKKLAARGYESYVETSVSAGDKYYRVKVGRLASKDEASKMASRLESDGYRINICNDAIYE